MVRAVAVLLCLGVGACAATRPPPQAAPPPILPLDGPVLERWTTDAGVDVELRLVGRSVWRDDLPRLPGTVVTAAAELPPGFVPREPVDFAAWVGVVMHPSHPGPVVVVRPEAQVTAGETRFVLSGPPPICGGASVTDLRAREADAALRQTLVLVPRRPRVTIGVVDTRCNPALP